jgi:hypothetical protein
MQNIGMLASAKQAEWHTFARWKTIVLVAVIGTLGLPIRCAAQRAQGKPGGQHALRIPTYKLDPSFPPPSNANFNTVSWVTWNSSFKQLWVLQRSNPVVTVWSRNDELQSQWNTDALGDPHSLSFSRGPKEHATAWIADMAPPLLAGTGFGHCLKQFTLDGALLSTIGTCGENSQGTGLHPVQFDEVTDMQWEASGKIIVTDGDLNGLNNRVLKLTPAGGVLAAWSAPGDKPGSGPGEFNLPHTVLVDRCNRLWVADALNHRVQVLSKDGTFYGEIKAFGTLGVYALAFGNESEADHLAVLFVGASPSSGGGTGVVSLFHVQMACSDPKAIGTGKPFTHFEVPIPTSTSTTLLHSIAVDPETWDVYLCVLGSHLPPQKWTAIWTK